MKKIGIMTLNGYRNYGNRLQNYALETFLSRFGYSVETIRYLDIPKSGGMLEKIWAHIHSKDFFDAVKYRVNLKFNKEVKIQDNLLKKREVSFKKFSEEFIHENSNVLDKNDLKNNDIITEINSAYVTMFVGLDQVWNLEGKSFPENYFLPFLTQEKRNSFAASFGFSKIPKESFREKYLSALQQMNSISVREEAGNEIVKDLTGSSASVLLDPTFLLSEQDWLGIVKQSNWSSKGNYLVTYFLGEITKNYEKIISEVCKKYELERVDLNDVKNPHLFSIAPDEFIDVLSNAKFVITDSFHGTVFSIIFGCAFISLDRVDNMGNMNSRIIKLLQKFNLEDHYISVNNLRSAHKNDFNFSKYETQKIIDKNVDQSTLFVRDVLSNLDDNTSSTKRTFTQSN